MSGLNTFEEDEFYWCKIRYNLNPEPLVRWEVLHYEESCWWHCATEGPWPEDDILEVRRKLERPES